MILAVAYSSSEALYSLYTVNFSSLTLKVQIINALALTTLLPAAVILSETQIYYAGQYYITDATSNLIAKVGAFNLDEMSIESTFSYPQSTTFALISVSDVFET